jgi:hypothetical protein
MIDESDFRVWQQSDVTRLLYKFLKNGIEDLKNYIVKNRDFSSENALKENYLKGLIDAYAKCLEINLEDLRALQQEKEEKEEKKEKEEK